jgi:hypothetical protein
MSTGSTGRVTETDVPGGQGSGFGTWLVDLDRDVAGEQHADPGHRAEEGPGRHDPVAVLDELHLQPFGPHEHVYRPFDLVAAEGLGRALTPWPRAGGQVSFRDQVGNCRYVSEVLQSSRSLARSRRRSSSLKP